MVRGVHSGYKLAAKRSSNDPVERSRGTIPWNDPVERDGGTSFRLLFKNLDKYRFNLASALLFGHRVQRLCTDNGVEYVLKMINTMINLMQIDMLESDRCSLVASLGTRPKRS